MRSPAAPGVPTIAESGVKGYDYSSWIGLLAPAKTPAAVITKLNEEAVKVLHSRDMQRILAVEATEPVGNTPAEFTAIMKTQVARWIKVVKAAGIGGG